MSSETGLDMSWFHSRTWAAVFAIVALGCTSSAAQAAAPATPPIGTVLREIPPDLWHFISWDTGAVLGIGGAAALVGHTWDDDLAREVETNVSLNNAMAPGHTYGAFTAQALISVGLYAGGWFGKKERLARTGADIMRAQVLSQVYVQAIKYTAQRERPDKSNHQSFPSGHSASAFATAGRAAAPLRLESRCAGHGGRGLCGDRAGA